MTTARQLALPFTHIHHYDPADFLTDPANADAQAWLAAAWPANRLALWGAEGCGKTHLAHLWASRQAATVMDGAALRGLPPIPSGGGIAVDDADTAAEEPLLHLVNAAAEAGLPVLLTAREPPARWRTVLPDLASRLRATTAVALHPPGDAMLRTLFARLLAARQVVVAEPLQDWILLRLPREPAALREAAARLDRAALAAGGAVTRGLAAYVVEAMAEHPA